MLHTDKDTMEIAKIGLRDNIIEIFVVHKYDTTARKACTIEEVQEIDGGEVGAPIVKIVGSGPIVEHKSQSSEHAKVGKKPNVVREAQISRKTLKSVGICSMLEEDCISAERSNSSGDDESEDDDFQRKSDDADSDER
ncbi:hypothetical protein AHAS_Ahas19G0187900 [Arachis hypogaea]